MDLHTPYSAVSFRMTLGDLARHSMTRSVVRSLCNSWASCYTCHTVYSSLPSAAICFSKQVWCV